MSEGRTVGLDPAAVFGGDTPVRAGSRPTLKVALRISGCVRLIAPQTIRWVLVEGDKCIVATGSDRLLVREPLVRLTQRLPLVTMFQIQRGSLVNLEYVTEIRRTRSGDYEFVLDDGNSLRSGPTYRTAIRRLLSTL